MSARLAGVPPVHPPTLMRGVEVDGQVCDVGIVEGAVRYIGHGGDKRAYEMVIDGRGGGLIPGLHDHHLHVLALAAARASVSAGPPDVMSGAQLGRALSDADRRLPPGTWLRAVAFHESVEPSLDRDWLDRMVPDRPVRVQHRSGRQWILNSRALEVCGLHDPASVSGASIDCDADGRLTGRITGADTALRHLWNTGRSVGDSVLRVSRELASYGITGITDATPFAGSEDMEPLIESARVGGLLQHLMVMGAPALRPSAADVHPATLGPAKLVIADDSIPSIEAIIDDILAARSLGRTVAVHCVTRIALVLCLAALEETGVVAGDRIEHGAIVDRGLARQLARMGLLVVTQPNFVFERGDNYLIDVEEADQPHLYPCGSLIAEGIGVAGSTDAPFGHPDPWRAMRAATERRTASGKSIGSDERVSAYTALSLFLGTASAPTGPARRIAIGSSADVCLLHVPVAEALRSLSAGNVRAAWIQGRMVHGN